MDNLKTYGSRSTKDNAIKLTETSRNKLTEFKLEKNIINTK